MTATISEVTVEAFQNDGDNVRKAVVHFHGNVIKPLVVNKTNYVILAHAFGPNTDAWVGKQIIRLAVHDAVQRQNGGDHPVSSHCSRRWRRPAMAPVNHTTGAEKIARMEAAAVLKHQGLLNKENWHYLCATERRNPEVLVMIDQRPGQRSLAGTFIIE